MRNTDILSKPTISQSTKGNEPPTTAASFHFKSFDMRRAMISAIHLESVVVAEVFIGLS